MTWIFLGRTRLEPEWVLFPEVDAEIFQVTHVVSQNPEENYLKAVIAVGIFEDVFKPLDSQLLSYSRTPTLVSLPFPKELAIPRIGIKRLDSSSVNWNVIVESRQGVIAQSSIVNEVVKAITPLFEMSSSHNASLRYNLYPRAKEVICEKNSPVLLQPQNEKRCLWTIDNHNKAEIILATQLYLDPETSDKLLKNHFMVVNSKKYYEMPVIQNSIYTGDIFGLAGFDGKVTVVEWEKTE
ncbi:MAG: hypothetical protein QNJ47_05400 [Nostocaceae cyanobacterium]|nr:hypothetical protein [Nostocaceae cyanobacterium]